MVKFKRNKEIPMVWYETVGEPPITKQVEGYHVEGAPRLVAYRGTVSGWNLALIVLLKTSSGHYIRGAMRFSWR